MDQLKDLFDIKKIIIFFDMYKFLTIKNYY